MTAAARENDRKLKGRFGKASWKVALEPERRTAYVAVSVHALSPLADKILMGITE